MNPGKLKNWNWNKYYYTEKLKLETSFYVWLQLKFLNLSFTFLKLFNLIFYYIFFHSDCFYFNFTGYFKCFYTVHTDPEQNKQNKKRTLMNWFLIQEIIELCVFLIIIPK